MRHVAIVALLLALLGPFGCVSQDSRVVGTWKVQMDRPPEAKNDPAAALGNAVGNAFANILVGPLQMKADHTFNANMMGAAISGTWSTSGSNVTLNFEKASVPNGSASANTEPLVLVISDDGKTMSTKNNQGSLTFVKE